MKNNVLQYISLSMLFCASSVLPCLASSQSVLDPYSDIQAPGANDENSKKGKKFKFPSLSHSNEKKEEEKRLKDSQIVKIIPTGKKTTVIAKKKEEKSKEPGLIRKAGMFKVVKNTPNNNMKNRTNSVLYENEPSPTVVAKKPPVNDAPKLSEGLKQIKDGYVNTFKAATGGLFSGAKSVASAKPVHELPNKVCQGSKSAIDKVAGGLKTGGESIHKGLENAGSKLADSAKGIKESTGNLLSKVAIHKQSPQPVIIAKPTQNNMVSAPVNTPNTAIPIHTQVQNYNNAQMAQGVSNPSPKQGIWQKLNAKFNNKKQSVQTASTTNSLTR